MNVQTVASSCERVCRHSQTFARGRKVVYLPCLSWYGLFGCGVWVLVHKGISRLQPWRGNAEGMQGILCPAHSLRCATCCWDGIFWSRVHPESQHCHWVLITLRRKSPVFRCGWSRIVTIIKEKEKKKTAMHVADWRGREDLGFLKNGHWETLWVLTGDFWWIADLLCSLLFHPRGAQLGSITPFLKLLALKACPLFLTGSCER